MATLNYDISRDGSVTRNLGDGDDTVVVSADSGVQQVRLTFTSAEVGDGDARASDTLANQDGGLAVRMRAENGAGILVGAKSRFDDEGLAFESDGGFTFEVRDLVSGVSRGDAFDTVELGTEVRDIFNETDEDEAYYINAGMGNDRVTTGRGDDFLVGGAGRDRLSGHEGDDSFIGGTGRDYIYGDIGADLAIFNVATDGTDRVDLGKGLDTINVAAPVTTTQIRLTFTSAEVGDGAARDADTLTNQDGGLAVRLQAENGADGVVGGVSRFDDEGVSFVSTVEGLTFDVRDLVSDAARGDQFEVVMLGTDGNNRFDETGEDEAYYINGGVGNDRLTGGLAEDFLVGGLGRDQLNGREGGDSLLGGADGDAFVFSGDTGDDLILDFVSGVDKIDLSAFAITFADVDATASGPDTLVDVDTDGDTVSDFEITLAAAGAPVEGDYLFA